MELDIQIEKDKIFAPLLNKWVTNTQEEKLKQEFIKKLVSRYGYSLEQLGQDVQIKRRFKADIAIWKSEQEKKKNKVPSIIIAVECKPENISIKKEDYEVGYKFADAVEADFFIATNLKETKIFHLPKLSSKLKLEELKNIPKAVIIGDEKKIEKFIDDTKQFTRDQFSKLLFKCHNIIRNNDKLSPEAAFDEISKILFMKIMHERNPDKEILFSREVFFKQEKVYEDKIRPELEKSMPLLAKDYMQYLFDETKRAYEKDALFEPNEQIRLKRTSFEAIVKELEEYNLSNTSDDIKGIAFEEFLGKTFRGELGQFFTPRTIVNYMVEILDPQEGEKICDPCCGSGGFLIKTFDYVREKIEADIQKTKLNIRDQLRGENFDKLPVKKQDVIKKREDSWFINLDEELNIENSRGRLRRLSYNCIFGTDANPRMARTAKMNMIMHGDGHGGVHHNDGLLNVNGIHDEQFDVILTNPPFGARVNKNSRITHSDLPSEQKILAYKEKYENYEEKVLKPLQEWVNYEHPRTKLKGKPILELFDVGKMNSLTEVLFMERCINLLKPGGRMGIVLPEGVLNNSALQKVREYMEGRAKIINITSIPRDVFIASGANIKPSLIFFKRFTEEEKLQYDKIVANAENKINNQFKSKLEKLESDFSEQEKVLKDKKATDKLKVLRKNYKQEKKHILSLIEKEVRAILKKEFDYTIPVVEVEKAGITSTGAPCENQLEDVVKEFIQYRKNVSLWDDFADPIKYVTYENGTVHRLVGINEPEVFYGKNSK